MKNNDGFSWPETIVSLSIIFLLAATLLPLLSNMTVQLEEKRRKYHSTVVMHEGIKMYIAENIHSGFMYIDKLPYNFKIDEEQICVNYEGVRKELDNCVSISY